MIVYNHLPFPALANMAFFTRACVLIFLLIFSQKTQVSALPIGNATGLLSTSILSKTLIQNIWENTTTTQYPPTTTVQNTIPGTIGVSGFSFHHLET